MKLISFAAAALAATLAAPASAMVSVQDLNANVRSAVQSFGSGQVSVNVRGDTAYLRGWVESANQRHAAVRAALGTNGIECVVNGILD